MSDRVPDPYHVQCGDRLQRAREALGYNRRAFARITLADDDDIASVKRAEAKLEKYEAGINRVPTAYIRKLKATFGIDMNYVFDGDMASLSPDLRTKLIETERV